PREITVEYRRNGRLGDGPCPLCVSRRRLFGRCLDGLDDQRLLAFEVAIEAADGEAERAHDVRNADGSDSAQAEETRRRLDDPPSRLGGVFARATHQRAPSGWSARTEPVTGTAF